MPKLDQISDDLGRSIATLVRETIDERLSISPDQLDKLKATEDKIAAERRKATIEAERVQDLIQLFENGGVTPMGRQLVLKDLMASNELRNMIPQVVQAMVTGPLDPVPKLQGLFKKLTIPAGQQISFPSIGGFADAEDMGEAEQYPTLGKIEMAGQITALAKKVGCKISFTDEAWTMAQSSQFFNYFTLLMAALKNSFTRTKERKAAQFLLRQGYLAYDNLGGSGRRTNGRDHTGARNGTLISNDIVRLWSEMTADGFNPDTIIMNPMTFPMFLNDPELRSWALATGISEMQNLWNPTTGSSGFSKFKQNTPALHKVHNQFKEASDLNNVPFSKTLPFTLRPIVTPWSLYNPGSGVIPAYADIIILDSNYAGYLIDNGPLSTGEWVNPETDIRNIKAHEKYAFATDMKGVGIRVLRGIAVDRHAFDFINRFSYSPTFSSPLDLDGTTTDTVYS